MIQTVNLVTYAHPTNAVQNVVYAPSGAQAIKYGDVIWLFTGGPNYDGFFHVDGVTTYMNQRNIARQTGYEQQSVYQVICDGSFSSFQLDGDSTGTAGSYILWHIRNANAVVPAQQIQFDQNTSVNPLNSTPLTPKLAGSMAVYFFNVEAGTTTDPALTLLASVGTRAATNGISIYTKPMVGTQSASVDFTGKTGFQGAGVYSFELAIGTALGPTPGKTITIDGLITSVQSHNNYTDLNVSLADHQHQSSHIFSVSSPLAEAQDLTPGACKLAISQDSGS